MSEKQRKADENGVPIPARDPFWSCGDIDFAIDPEQIKRENIKPVCPNCGPDKQMVAFLTTAWPVACRCLRCLAYWEIERPSDE